MISVPGGTAAAARRAGHSGTCLLGDGWLRWAADL